MIFEIVLCGVDAVGVVGVFLGVSRLGFLRGPGVPVVYGISLLALFLAARRLNFLSTA